MPQRTQQFYFTLPYLIRELYRLPMGALLTYLSFLRHGGGTAIHTKELLDQASPYSIYYIEIKVIPRTTSQGRPRAFRQDKIRQDTQF